MGARFADFVDRLEFRRLLAEGKAPEKIDAILHQGACTDTMEYDGAYMMRTNYDDSKALLHIALDRKESRSSTPRRRRSTAMRSPLR